jgi:hypothetical protein
MRPLLAIALLALVVCVPLVGCPPPGKGTTPGGPAAGQDGGATGGGPTSAKKP